MWLANYCSIMSGVSIGDGAVVAAYSVVTKDVPAYAIVGGNPARVIRYRFDEEVIGRLLHIKWWDRPESEVRKLVPYLVSGDIETFLSMAEGAVPLVNYNETGGWNLTLDAGCERQR